MVVQDYLKNKSGDDDVSKFLMGMEYGIHKDPDGIEKEGWGWSTDIRKLSETLFGCIQILQERIIHLENECGSSAFYPNGFTEITNP